MAGYIPDGLPARYFQEASIGI